MGISVEGSKNESSLEVFTWSLAEGSSGEAIEELVGMEILIVL